MRYTETITFERQHYGEKNPREVSALRSMRLGKASLRDGITADFLIKIWDPGIDFVVMFKKPTKRQKSVERLQKVFIPLLRKPGAQECKDFRTIA